MLGSKEKKMLDSAEGIQKERMVVLLPSDVVLQHP